MKRYQLITGRSQSELEAVANRHAEQGFALLDVIPPRNGQCEWTGYMEREVESPEKGARLDELEARLELVVEALQEVCTVLRYSEQSSHSADELQELYYKVSIIKQERDEDCDYCDTCEDSLPLAELFRVSPAGELICKKCMEAAGLRWKEAQS